MSLRFNAKSTVLGLFASGALFASLPALPTESMNLQSSRGITAHLEHNYFNWNGDQDRSGWQRITPVTITYAKKNWEIGLRRAYIESENESTGSQGRVATWSDTSLSTAFTLGQLAWPVRLSLDYNEPNGKASLEGDEKNAIMDAHLVQQTRFGEGRNVTPGISVTRALGAKDTFGVGLSKVFRGAFDPNSDVANDRTNPGDETIATVQWHHAEQKWLVTGGLTYIHSGVTKREDVDYYRKGELWNFDATGVAFVGTRQQLVATYRYSYRERDRYINNVSGQLEKERFNSNGESHFLALDWAYKWHPQHVLHVLADYLDIARNEYDQINSLFIPRRKKWGVGLRYDYHISSRSSISVSAKHFRMEDEQSPNRPTGEDYDGSNVYLLASIEF